MSELPHLKVDRKENKAIIDELFGDESKIPIADIRSYELPTSFWKSIKSRIDEYKQSKYDIDLFKRFYDEFIFQDTIFEDDPHVIYDLLGEHLGISEKERVLYYINHPEFIEGLDKFNSKLCEYYRDNGHLIEIDRFEKNEKSKFSNFKRELVREQYLEWDTLLTDDFYKEDSDFIEYPILMIDRVSLQVYSKDFMTFKGDVRKVVRDTASRFTLEAQFEQEMYKKHALSKMGYDEDDIQDYANHRLPADLDKEYNFMEHRSILSGFNVTSKPEIFKDSYLWKTDGITYRIRHNPTKGAPISLFIYANLQRIVYNRMKEDIPEVEEAFNHELLDENNFIPMGYEKEYLKYEKKALEELKDKALGTYQVMLERNGFGPGEVRSSEMIFNINQIEICWNKELPLDPLEYLKERMSEYHDQGIVSSSLHDNTPLLVTSYMSDVEPNVKRFAHKMYKKTKKNLRNEIVLGNELKLSADIGNGRFPIHTQFFTSSQEIKRYLYAKLIFHLLRRTTGFDKEKYQHSYHQLTNKNSHLNDKDKEQYLAAYLKSTDLHGSFKDFYFFNNLVNELRTKGFVTRKFFHPWSNRFFDKNVSRSDDFERMKRGRYRVKHRSYLENIVEGYMKLRNNLTS